jgi:PAS domain S-box-containing protein
MSIAIGLMVVVATLCLVLGASYVNYSQIRSKNKERLNAATSSYQRELERMILADEQVLRDFTSKLDVAQKYRAMVITDFSGDDMAERTTNLAVSLKAENLAFYYKTEDEDNFKLRHYYAKKRNGTTVVLKDFHGRNGKMEHVLYTRDENGMIAKSRVSDPGIFPKTFEKYNQSNFLVVENNMLLLRTIIPFISVFYDELYSLTKGYEIGRFVLEKKLELDIEEMDKDLGVHFNVYDNDGTMGDGHLNMPDLDLSTGEISSAGIVELSDVDEKKYDSLLLPLKYEDAIIGYLSANIPEDLTAQKIFETVALLLMIACGIIISFFFLSLLLANQLTKPILKLTKVSELIAAGKLEEEIDERGNDELGILSRSILNMRDSIRNKIVDLAKKNEELLTEITERKKADKALLESERRFRTIIDTALEGIWITDKDGLTAYVNQRILDLLGFTFDEMLGKPVSDFLDVENTEIFENEAKRHKGGVGYQYDIRFRRKDGTELWGIVSTTPLLDSEGYAMGGFSMITDITDRKQAEDEKRQLEVRLQRAEKMEAIGTLAGGVAHDLNNVLSGLVSYPDLILLDLPEDSHLKESVLTIQDSGKRAAAIVEDLLTLARRGVSVSDVVNLNDIVNDYLSSPEHEKLKSFFPKAQFKTDLQGELFNILGSPVHLSKTVMNLLSNAIESLRDGGTVAITTRNQYIDRPIKGYDEVKEGDYVVLSVADSGVGIGTEDLEKIFEPFYTKKVMGRSGTGLGMAVVWGTVKDHDGYIIVESTKGKGSKFTLFFPITRKEADKGELASIDEYLGNGEKILVVDDVPQQREIASVLLKKLEYSVDVVSSGEEAVEYIKKNSPDLLILDMIMDPGMDGLDTFKKVLELQPGQKAIIASGFSETKRVKEAQKLGAGQYVKKPYTLEKIGLAVKAELSR